MRTLYKICFQSAEAEKLELYAEAVVTADIFGFVEVSGIVFIDSSELIITPEDDKVRKIFKNTVRTLIPLASIVRIDEIQMSTNTPVIRLYKE